METFKYYKRGEGELDTSNFPLIAFDRQITVDNLDEKTFMSLLALNEFLKGPGIRAKVFVEGYVAHMRSDKDRFHVAKLYDLLFNLDIYCKKIQHESTGKVRSSRIGKKKVAQDLDIELDNTIFVGADKSVPKFFVNIDSCAQKIRENGKVTSISMKLDVDKHTNIVIVDDILGGGATIEMLLKVLQEQGYKNFMLWTAYNESIHTEFLLKNFSKYYIGQKI